MRWIAKENCFPIYVWWEDEWYNETDKSIYTPCKHKMEWVGEYKSFPFTKKTKVLSK